MGYRNLRQCIEDLERTGQLVRIERPVDPDLEAAEIQRRVFQAGGPAVYFASVRGCRFPMVSNLFGTRERMEYLFRDTLAALRRLVRWQLDPADLVRKPRLLLQAPLAAWRARPRSVRRGPVLGQETTVEQLPQLRSWPEDGGAYITLPVVYTEDPDRPGLAHSNLGMYRVQISGGQYAVNREVGLHYQIHRGIAVHHAAALRRKEKLRVNVFVGGPPAVIVAAVMPLPEGVSELAFAGLLAGHRIPMITARDQLAILVEADFCITGYLDPDKLLPEGPFGDHLGYYSLRHDFPVMRVEKVYHRDRPVWPFTVVGRPPQEDAMFAHLVHDLVGPVVPREIPGVKAVHAVQEAGVHPLLLAIGSERYVPYEQPRRPRELLTQANAILGHGQLSLAKYLFIVAEEDNPELDIHDVADFLRHVLERTDWRTNLHFQTHTTMDTLDYSGEGLNQGSKVFAAVAGPVRRTLPVGLDRRIKLPEDLGFGDPRVVLPGILAVRGPAYRPQQPGGRDAIVQRFCSRYRRDDPLNLFPLVVVVDDSEFVARTLANFLWTTFTRSNPAADIYGVESFLVQKHWGCFGSLVIDARAKPHHAPPLVEDPKVTRRVDELAAPGGPLHGII
ncbi:MAG TPA: UbiD family decarboxylase [Planctomycetaceae bacterium]|nr:UbiD family decarboxylase [Planctomycetaceae bacterium]